MIFSFAHTIDQLNSKLTEISSETVTSQIQNNFQIAILHIENYIESINTAVNITMNSVAILSVRPNSSIDSFSQIKNDNSSLTYGAYANNLDSIASITIDPTSIKNLLNIDVYTFYYLPSSLFYYAQEDQSIIIVSPIVGVHIPNNAPRLINMSFIDMKRSSGKYSCVFWHFNQWNDTGCSYFMDSQLNRHFCSCNHTTSFALIFIPHKTTSFSTVPSIFVAVLSIICFLLSIILSISRRTKSFRHLSIINIFSLFNSIMLFAFLATVLIRGYKSSTPKSKIQTNCSIVSQNLVITTYFYLILTFASKTLLGIYYFLTIFVDFIFVEFTILSKKSLFGSLLLVILIAIIPTIVVKVMIHKQTNLFIQYEGICWFDSSFVFQFISIPILIFLGFNLLIIFGVTIRLIQFFIGRTALQRKDKRMIVSIMIWITLCISLGIAWIFGPFLNFIIQHKLQTSSIIIELVFSFFIGLEGLWVLIVNIVFYFTQERITKNQKN